MILRRPDRPVPATNAISEEHESRCMIFTGKDTARALKDPHEISDLLKDEHNFVWFDLAEPTQDDLQLLQEEFSLHPTAVEDAALVHERPKIESYDTYWLVVLHASTLDDQKKLVLHEIAVFVGKNFVVTIRAHPVFALDEIERRWLSKNSIPHTSTGLLYVILDVVVDGYHPVATEYDERLVALENRVLGSERNRPQRVLREVLAFKRDLVSLRHAVSPVRDIVSPLVRGDLAPLDPALIAYFRDVYDHALRVTDQIDSIRDLLNSTLDIHLSSEAHRQGEVSKQLTTIATIFLPLSYLTGFFGQNFGWMVNHIDKLGSFLYLGIGSQVLALAILMIYFKRKGWF
ncbi:MAG: magnesium and cobalt transport protein CorA [Candidatus Eremiobacteraeota bacterium]|nr:magnesium and cobalt transport protein CorA [Candidatus Eremiobacteraeota bacterium]